MLRLVVSARPLRPRVSRAAPSVGLVLVALWGAGLATWGCVRVATAPSSHAGQVMGARWEPTCSTVILGTDLPGLTLPTGVDGLLALTSDEGGLETPYIAGDFCGPDPHDCSTSDLPLAGDYATFYVRRGEQREPIELRDVVPLPVAGPEAAALLALSSGYRVLCPSRAHGPGAVTRVPGGYEVVGVRRSCEATYGATVRVSDEGEVSVMDQRVLEPFGCRDLPE
jgi:hypothetical protein